MSPTLWKPACAIATSGRSSRGARAGAGQQRGRRVDRRVGLRSRPRQRVGDQQRKRRAHRQVGAPRIEAGGGDAQAGPLARDQQRHAERARDRDVAGRQRQPARRGDVDVAEIQLAQQRVVAAHVGDHRIAHAAALGERAARRRAGRDTGSGPLVGRRRRRDAVEHRPGRSRPSARARASAAASVRRSTVTVRPRLSSAPSRYRSAPPTRSTRRRGRGGTTAYAVSSSARSSSPASPAPAARDQLRLQPRVGREHVGQLVPPALARRQLQAQRSTVAPPAAMSTATDAGVAPKFCTTSAASTAPGSAGRRRAANEMMPTLPPRRPTCPKRTSKRTSSVGRARRAAPRR